ncbi:MAG: hypothetical protein BWK76_18025 [Desulfobulbaceae bacterium A2]|nr:MAG: hypothetical protein BWK76_18025 [Desulfobulbaceae bacterium A2]
MTTFTRTFLPGLTMTLALALSPSVQAAEGHGPAHAMPGHDMGTHASMEHAHHQGDSIREATVEGYRLSYQMIDNLAQLRAAQQAGRATNDDTIRIIDPARIKSHHLMLHIVGPDGRPVTDAKVGFLTKGTDGAEQTAMAMAMDGGYGADIELRGAGGVTIKSKTVVAGKTLLDEFAFKRE